MEPVNYTKFQAIIITTRTKTTVYDHFVEDERFRRSSPYLPGHVSQVKFIEQHKA